MLVLNRKEKESFLIYPYEDLDPNMTIGELFKDGAIEIYLNDINKSQVKLAVTAPKELYIVRAELVDI